MNYEETDLFCFEFTKEDLDEDKCDEIRLQRKWEDEE